MRHPGEEERVPLPWDPRDETKPDSMDWDEGMAWLGWEAAA